MSRDPSLLSVPIADLRPTQITVGYHEVAEKRRRWNDMTADKRNEFVALHMVPVIRGPKDAFYAIDHHHLLRALQLEGCETVFVLITRNLGHLDKEAFWVFLDNACLCHPYDADGKRVNFSDIPKAVKDLQDDPFRSLAGALRRAGGFAKESAPFVEFLWADFLRRRLKRKLVEQDFSASVIQALTLAKSSEAKFLPGWCGASED